MKKILFSIVALLLFTNFCFATVSSTTDPTITYNGNDATVSFPVPFGFIDDTDLVVIHTDGDGSQTTWTKDAAGDSGYTVSGSTVTANTAPSSGTTLTIYRAIPMTQGLDLQQGRKYNPNLLEDALDRLTYIAQDIESLADASVQQSAAAASATSAAASAAEAAVYAEQVGANEYYPDYSEADQGVTATGNGITIYDAVQAIGSKKGTIVLIHNKSNTKTEYNLDTNLDLSSKPDIQIIFRNGALLKQVTGDETITFYSPSNIKASVSQKIFNADMVSFSRGGTIHPGWWGCLPEPDVSNSGTPLQYALNSCSTNYPSLVKLQPGSYTSTVTVNFAFTAKSSFDAISTIWTKTNSGDVFTINANQTVTPNNCEYIFGDINHANGSAIRSYGQFIQAYISWQGLYGTSRTGYGLYLDSDTADGGAAQSVITLDVGYIEEHEYGIYLSSNTNIDTITANTKHGYIYKNDIGLYVRSQSSGNQINANVWNLNIDASDDSGDIAVKTNENYSRFNLIVGGIGAWNILLSSYDGHSAQYNDLTNVRPTYLAYGSTYLSDSSSNNTNIYPRYDALPISLSVGSSPWTYQNTLHQDMYVALSGGTISAVYLSSDDITYYQVATSSDIMILLPKQMYIKVTYSSAPTTVGYLY